MKKLTNDHRTRVTRMLIRRALMSLLAQKPIQSISVKELCELAGINRSTFYAHYTDLHDLLQQIEDEMFADFEKALETLYQPGTAGPEPVAVTTEVFQCLKDNSDLCTVTLSDYGDKAFALKLLQRGRECCVENYLQYFKGASPRQVEYYYAFVSAGCIGLLRRWLDDGMLLPAGELAEMAENIMMRGLSFLQEEH